MNGYQRLMLSAGGGFTSKDQIKLQQNEAHLFIGLGGTGIDALANLKAAITEWFEDSDVDQSMRFLAVDTDHSTLDRLEAAGMPLQPKEFIGMNTQLQDVPDRMLRNRTDMAWLGEEPISYPSSMAKDTAGSRAYGRIQFILHSADFIGKVSQLLYEVCRVGRRHVQIHIFSSLSGGTGSGVLLDVCYLVREAVKRLGMQGAKQVNTYLFLPDIYPLMDAAHRRLGIANCYAALKEWDYYMQVKENGGAFSQVYPNGLCITWDTAPADLCCLISATGENGLIRTDGYAYALSVVTEQILSLLAAAPAFGITGPLAPILPMMPNKNVKDGACRNYVMLGAASVDVPKKVIDTYLACGVFEKFSCFDEPSNPANLVDEVMSKTNLKSEKLYHTLRMAADRVEYHDYTPADGKNIDPEQIEQSDRLMLERRCEEITRKAEQLINRYDKESYCALIDKELSGIASDIHYGPLAAAALLHPHREYTLLQAIGEQIRQARMILKEEQKKLDECKQAVEEARKKVGGLFFRRKWDAYRDIWREYLHDEQNIAIQETSLYLLAEVEKQLKDVVVKRYHPLAEAWMRLRETMQENQAYLQKEAGKSDGWLFDLDTVRSNLDAEIANADANAHFPYLIDALLQDDFEIRDDEAVAKCVNAFFMHQVFAGRTDTILSGLEWRYRISDPYALMHRLEHDVLAKMTEQVSEGWVHAEAPCRMTEFMVPSKETVVEKACSQFAASLNGTSKVSGDLREGHIGLVRYTPGIPLYALYCINEYGYAYEDLKRKGHISFGGPSGDWRKLPGLIPQSKITDGAAPIVRDEIEEARALYDLAAEHQCLIMTETGCVVVRRLLREWQEELRELMRCMQECIKREDSFDAQTWMIKAEEMIANPQFDPAYGIELLCTNGKIEPSSVIPNVTCDRFVSSLACRQAVLEYHTVMQSIARLMEQLQKVADNQQDKHEFFEALFTGVITVHGLSVECQVDSFGLEEKIVLSQPFMPYGRLPLYQAYLNFCLLYEGSKEQIRMESEERLMAGQYRLSNSLIMWRDRYEWMHLEDRIRAYPVEEQRQILRFYGDLVAAMKELIG